MGLYDDRLADLSESRRPRGAQRQLRCSDEPLPSRPLAGRRCRRSLSSSIAAPVGRRAKSKAWAQSHGYQYGKVDVTDQYVRLRQFDPKGSKVKRTIPFGRGIRAVVAREETSMRTSTVKSPRRRKTAKRAKRKTAKKASRPRRRARKVKVEATRKRRRHSQEDGEADSIVGARVRAAHRGAGPASASASSAPQGRSVAWRLGRATRRRLGRVIVGARRGRRCTRQSSEAAGRCARPTTVAVSEASSSSARAQSSLVMEAKRRGVAGHHARASRSSSRHGPGRDRGHGRHRRPRVRPRGRSRSLARDVRSDGDHEADGQVHEQRHRHARATRSTSRRLPGLEARSRRASA